jgi:hypothetical protein
LRRRQFEARLFASFSSAPKPGLYEIVDCIDVDCTVLRDSFFLFEHTDLPDNIIGEQFCHLPLLSDKAYRYYLPAYLRCALKEPHLSVMKFVLFSLLPDDVSDENWIARRKGTFTEKEIGAVREFLLYVQKSKILVYDDGTDDALEFNFKRGLEMWVP